MSQEFWEALFSIIAIFGVTLVVYLIVRFRFDVKFDVNKWLEARSAKKRQQQDLQLKNVCTHVRAILEDGAPGLDLILFSNKTFKIIAVNGAVKSIPAHIAKMI